MQNTQLVFDLQLDSIVWLSDLINSQLYPDLTPAESAGIMADDQRYEAEQERESYRDELENN